MYLLIDKFHQALLFKPLSFNNILDNTNFSGSNQILMDKVSLILLCIYIVNSLKSLILNHQYSYVNDFHLRLLLGVQVVSQM